MPATALQGADPERRLLLLGVPMLPRHRSQPRLHRTALSGRERQDCGEGGTDVDVLELLAVAARGVPHKPDAAPRRLASDSAAKQAGGESAPVEEPIELRC